MAENLADLLNLRVAWRRVKSDLKHRSFVTHPYELALVEADLNGWLAAVDELVRSGRYHPGSMVVCEVPKGGGLIRPGNYLNLVDRVIYTACVGACFPLIHEALDWAQGVVDFAYRLSTDPDDPQWLRSQFTGWQDFRKESLRLLNTGEWSDVVFADIAAFYETIDISLLISDLRSLGTSDQVVDQISRCLNRWAQVPGRGLPQGISASDILAKLYLNGVDLNIRAIGYTHIRYVDDLRILVKSRTDAKKGLMNVVQFLRRRGLHVQSAKTVLHTTASAIEDIEHVVHTVTEVGQRLVQSVKAMFGDASPYISIAEIDRILAENPEEAPVEVLQQAYSEFFSDPDSENFDATFFRFLLGRLAQVGSGFPLMFRFSEFLRTHPEETGTVTTYLSAVDQAKNYEDDIVEFLRGDDAIYPYQRYQLLTWLDSAMETYSESTIALARSLSFDSSQPSYVRSVSQKILGAAGTRGDLERLEHLYAELSSPLEQSELICCLQRVEVSRRNGFLARAERDGDLQGRAAKLVRTAAIG